MVDKPFCEFRYFHFEDKIAENGFIVIRLIIGLRPLPVINAARKIPDAAAGCPVCGA